MASNTTDDSIKCFTCGISLDATNTYLTAKRTKYHLCNECKGRRVSGECLLKILERQGSKTAIDASISDECLWYDCSCSSFAISNSADQDTGDNIKKGNHGSKNRGDVQMGYRDLHGRGSKDNLIRNTSTCADNVCNAGECTKNAAMKIRTSIPQRVMGNTGNLKKTLANSNISTSDVKILKTNSSNMTYNKGQSVLNSRNTESVTTFDACNENSSGSNTTASGAIPKVKPRYNLRKPSTSTLTKPATISTITPNPGLEILYPVSLGLESKDSDAQLSQSLSENSSSGTTKPKSFKNVVRKAFTFSKCSRLLPVKAFPPESKADAADEFKNDAIEDTENSLAKASKEKNMFLDCSICFDSLLDNGENELSTPPSSVVATKCGHIFHEKCIKEWLKAQSNKKCPICCSSCSASNLLTIFVDAGPHRQSYQTDTSSITDQEANEIHETLQNDYEDLKLKYDKLDAEHDLCGWKSVVIQSLQSAFDLESYRRQELERENEHLLQKMENLQLEAFIQQPFGLKPI